MTTSMTGRTLSHYEVLEKIGAGGMGVVYRARDTRLERFVALKVLRPEAVGDPERTRRFVREAKAASALNHPAIVVIYDIGNADGVDFIAMELVEGKPLDAILESGRLPVEGVVAIAGDVASALGAAHKAGIVHRDVKPANVMITESGRVKVLDFGLAKLVEREGPTATADSFSPTATGGDPRTQQGVVLGTLSYLSPEQAEGKPVDARSDVFSFGTMLYEMLSGRRPFQGVSTIGTLTAILRDAPEEIRNLRPEIPEKLARLVARCLQKKPENRYASAAEVEADLAALRAPAGSGQGSLLRRPAVLVPALLVALAAVSLLAASMRRSSRERAARQGLAELASLVEAQDLIGVHRRLESARRALPGDPELARAEASYSADFRFETEPSGAHVSFASYLKPELGWQRIGMTPISAPLPYGAMRIRAEKEGFDAFEGAPLGEGADGGSILVRIRLEPRGSAPEGMVRIPAGAYVPSGLEPVEVPQYWLDRLEVTNRRYKEFVDRGGYTDPRFWEHAFVRSGRTLPFEEAMEQFRDSTGRPGPAGWELGTYREGTEDFPVSGVSWFEAAAYAEFAGKTLPTVSEWYRATEQDIFSEILKLSNFGGDGPVRAATLSGLGPYGTLDMAGNVKEWCANGWEGKRYVAGGSWSDPAYLYNHYELADPWSRPPTAGFRCARPIGARPDHLSADVQLDPKEDLSKLRPAGDEAFRVYAGLYAYERTPLRARVEKVDETAPFWRKETVSFDAAYGEERVLAYLFLPRSSPPPWKTVVYFPDSSAEAFHSSEELWLRWVDFIVRSGRALVFPVYKGTYERRVTHADPRTAHTARRDLLLAWSKDLGRTLDYLETRRDIARESFVFYGFSLGATYAPVLCAMEPRLKSCILVGGGLTARKLPPEANPVNFVPRVTMPVLMIGGRDDFVRPVATMQVPLFRMLGTPEKDKRHALLEGGHLPPTMNEMIREILDWLDKYQGPVQAAR